MYTWAKIIDAHKYFISERNRTERKKVGNNFFIVPHFPVPTSQVVWSSREACFKACWLQKRRSRKFENVDLDGVTWQVKWEEGGGGRAEGVEILIAVKVWRHGQINIPQS